MMLTTDQVCTRRCQSTRCRLETRQRCHSVPSTKCVDIRQRYSMVVITVFVFLACIFRRCTLSPYGGCQVRPEPDVHCEHTCSHVFRCYTCTL